MLDACFKLKDTRDRHREGPLGAFVNECFDGLRRQGHTLRRLLRMIVLVGAFSWWLKRRGVGV